MHAVPGLRDSSVEYRFTFDRHRVPTAGRKQHARSVRRDMLGAMTNEGSRRLGSTGQVVSAIGLGCMGMSGSYGPADEDESVATIHAALDAGVTLLDTGDFYGAGHNELLVGRAIKDRPRAELHLSVKFGVLRGPNGEWGGSDTRPQAMRNFLAYSLVRLGTDYLDIYRPARLDPNVPIEDTVGAIAEQVKAGRVRHIGLSEVGAETIRRAAAVHPISDVQIEYSLLSRGIEESILPVCRELGIAITAYGVLSRGLISDSVGTEFAPSDFRAHSPRFQGDNLAHNRSLVDRLRTIAAGHHLTVAQLAIAWAVAQGRDIIPIIGMRRRSRLTEALAALEARLTPDDLAQIEDAVPAGAAAGERYAAPQLAQLDSER
jgi:aryl-alcohol dehydrogenase-like predicted oxidoreductase